MTASTTTQSPESLTTAVSSQKAAKCEGPRNSRLALLWSERRTFAVFGPASLPAKIPFPGI